MYCVTPDFFDIFDPKSNTRFTVYYNDGMTGIPCLQGYYGFRNAHGLLGLVGLG